VETELVSAGLCFRISPSRRYSAHCDQVGLLGILAPIHGDIRALKIILNVPGSVGFSLEAIERDAYIAVRDVACIIEVQRCENEYRCAVRRPSVTSMHEGDWVGLRQRGEER
jgi:hypothetical protein